jgi:hypothetical protein
MLARSRGELRAWGLGEGANLLLQFDATEHVASSWLSDSEAVDPAVVRHLLLSVRMGYLKTAALGVLASVAMGAAVGAYGILGAGNLGPADKAAVYSQAISEAMNCATFFTIVLVPVALVVVLLRNRRAKRL